jgi:hypothetical protein
LLLEGWFARNQTQISTLSATLAANDVGARVDVLDFNHISAWNGTAWARAPEDSEHSDSFHMFASAPSEPGWQICDGSNVSFYNYDGSTSNRTLPNTIAGNGGVPAYPRFETAYSAAIVGAASPSLTMDPYTPTGNISGTANISYTPGGTIASVFAGDVLGAHAHDAPISEAANGLLASILNVNGSGGSYTALASVVTAANNATVQALKTSAVSAGTPTGNVTSLFTGNAANFTVNGNNFTFTGNTATLTGNISLPGDPVNHWRSILYYRR